MTLRRLGLALFACLALALPAAPPINAAQLPPDPIVVNHDSVALFEQIPPAYLAAAQDLTMFYTDRSVGVNVNEGLGCLAGPHASSPAHCRVYIHADPTYNTTPADVYWPDVYPRTNWRFVSCTAIGCTLSEYDRLPVDVFGYFPSYLEAPGLAATFFTSSPTRDDVYDLVAFETAHPEATLIYFTSSLARGEGAATQQFNQQMRSFALANGKMFFDVADILSHAPDGHPCYDNRDSIPYNNGTKSENYPDDGLDTEAICPQYATEVDGGHLGAVSAGKIRVAKAFWVLMAQIAGWQPVTPPTPTPTRTATPSRTPTRTATPNGAATPTRTPASTLAPTATLTPTIAPTDISLPTPTATSTRRPRRTATPTLPPTETPTTTPPPEVPLHVGTLDGAATLGMTGRWSARVTIFVHDSAETPMPDTLVTGDWSDGATNTATCTTNAAGSCNVSANGLLLDSVASVTFTVSELNLADYSYAPASNHDPDGDSDGTQIIVFKP